MSIDSAYSGNRRWKTGAQCDTIAPKTGKRGRVYDQSAFRLPRQYTIKTRKLLIFKDFLGLLRAIYYPFTTFENQKN